MFWRTANKRRARQLFDRTLVTESLETRILPAVVNVMKMSTGAGTSLTFAGSAVNDDVFINTNATNGKIDVSSSLSTFVVNGVPSGNRFIVDEVLKDVTFRLGAGNDTIGYHSSASSVQIFDGATALERNQVLIGTSALAGLDLPVQISVVQMEIDRGNLNALVWSQGPNLSIGLLQVSLLRTSQTNIEVMADGGFMSLDRVMVSSPSTTSLDTIGFAASDRQASNRIGAMRLGTANIITGGGADSVAVQGRVTVSNRDIQERNLGFSVDTGAGNDIVGITSSALSSLQPNFHGRVTISTGDGDDTVNLHSEEGEDRLQFRASTVIQTGNNADRVFLERCQFMGSLYADTGTTVTQTADQMTFIGSHAAAGTTILMRGTGYLFINGSAASPAKFSAGVWFGIGRGQIDVGNSGLAHSNVFFSGAHLFVGLIDQLSVNFNSVVQSYAGSRILANARLVRR